MLSFSPPSLLAALMACMLTACDSRQERLTALTWPGGNVLACWRGNELIDPHDCIGKEVTAIEPLNLTDQAARFAAKRGKVVETSLLEFVRTARDDHPVIYAGYRLPSSPLPAGELATSDLADFRLPPSADAETDDHWNWRLPIFAASGDEPVASPVEAAWHGKRFADPATIEVIARLLREAYGSDAYSFWNRGAELGWADVDGDGIEEALAVVSTDGSCAHELVVVAFGADGSIRNRDQIIGEKDRCRLGLPMDAGYWWTFMVVPWPTSDRNLAIMIEAGTGGGDNFEQYVLPFDDLLIESKASAVFVAEFASRSDLPTD